MAGPDGVGRRLALLCLQGDGRLTDSRWADRAVRAGLLVDLALAGRLTDADDHVAVDATPTGDPLADHVAADLATSGRTLDEVVADGGPDLAEIARTLVAEGVWEPYRQRRWWRGERYRPVDPAVSRAAVSATLEGIGAQPPPPLAAATAIAEVAGLLGGRFGPVRDELVTAAGDAGWVVGTVVTGLASARSWYGAVTRMTTRDLHTPG
ncbi:MULTISPECIES: GPP34 family phosphoprotein [unclassified Geodermatophilus]|uniref:GPP34 family phosphoprotein n=1 Tax=unclassified Geodermatophilus TaxID=2637632 RepID=UPI003EEB328F